MSRTRSLALVFSFSLPVAAALVPTLASSTAFAEPPPAAQAPRTTFTGTFQRYLLMPNGRAMGLMLSDGTFVFTPGRALKRDAPSLTTGTKLEIEGVAVRTTTGTIVRRGIVKLEGNVIADATKAHRHHHHEDGEAREHHERPELQAVTGAGQIAAIVSSPRGRIQALVLTDGTTAVAHGLEGFGLKIGDRITVAGKGGVYPRGKSVYVEKITLPNGQTRDVPKPAPRDRERGQGPA
jgi:hypothetical protein